MTLDIIDIKKEWCAKCKAGCFESSCFNCLVTEFSYFVEKKMREEKEENDRT